MKKVIFDCDGVLLSEKRYFDVSGLVPWEFFYGEQFLNLGGEIVTGEPSDEQIDALRARFWQNDEILVWLKCHGVNDNCDMVHALLCASLALMLDGPVELNGAEDVCALGVKLRGRTVPAASVAFDWLKRAVPPDASKNDVFAAIAAAVADRLGPSDWTAVGSPFYDFCLDAFEEWYLGDEIYEQLFARKPYAPGKKGFLRREQPLGRDIGGMFRELKRRGYEIAVATGRSRPETLTPFETFGWLKEFDPLFVATAHDVRDGSRIVGIPLDKPHPFVYCVGAFGRRPDLYREYVEHPEKFKQGEYWFVGDSLADVWCAKAFGATMIAPLTGLDGAAARPALEAEGVGCIINSVEEILDILH